MEEMEEEEEEEEEEDVKFFPETGTCLVTRRSYVSTFMPQA